MDCDCDEKEKEATAFFSSDSSKSAPGADLEFQNNGASSNDVYSENFVSRLDPLFRSDAKIKGSTWRRTLNLWR